MSLVETVHEDQAVRAEARCLDSERRDAVGLARMSRQPEGGAPGVHPQTPDEFVPALRKLGGLIHLHILRRAGLRRAGTAADQAACNGGDEQMQCVLG